MVAQKKHRHTWRFNGTLGTDRVLFYCPDASCKEITERAATKAETRLIKSHQREAFADISAVHKMWNSYCNLVEAKGLAGYDASRLMEKWAAKQPEGHVFYVPCDDASFMGSDLWLIEHKTHNRYMGTSMVYIPQDEDRSRAFLYTGHRLVLAKTLKEIQRLAAPIQKQEAADAKAWGSCY